MTSADVKTDVKQELKYLVTVLEKNLWEVPSKLEIQCKKDVYFHLILLGIPSSMIMSANELGLGAEF